MQLLYLSWLLIPGMWSHLGWTRSLSFLSMVNLSFYLEKSIIYHFLPSHFLTQLSTGKFILSLSFKNNYFSFSTEAVSDCFITYTALVLQLSLFLLQSRSINLLESFVEGLIHHVQQNSQSNLCLFPWCYHPPLKSSSITGREVKWEVKLEPGWEVLGTLVVVRKVYVPRP